MTTRNENKEQPCNDALKRCEERLKASETKLVPYVPNLSEYIRQHDKESFEELQNCNSELGKSQKKQVDLEGDLAALKHRHERLKNSRDESCGHRKQDGDTSNIAVVIPLQASLDHVRSMHELRTKELKVCEDDRQKDRQERNDALRESDEKDEKIDELKDELVGKDKVIESLNNTVVTLVELSARQSNKSKASTPLDNEELNLCASKLSRCMENTIPNAAEETNLFSEHVHHESSSSKSFSYFPLIEAVAIAGAAKLASNLFTALEYNGFISHYVKVIAEVLIPVAGGCISYAMLHDHSHDY